ncbi:hypothetical protein C4K04_4453 [Pseudomonas chlororaphis]|uniref:Uncharacterized protein n=1 Tax=Pseudomonas chlororaphis TaxID=587753 RepID=A0A3G7TUN9_9PSED|nr:hypothetical protein [Pseudomonas chlororaphis]AZE50112.1 hypothetical protein C4K04_4453 [Pseudomonas chlororaphis]
MGVVLDQQGDITPSNFVYPADLMRYEHEGVVGKFRDEWDVEEAEALDIFSEMKKFLYISEYAQRQCIEFEIDEPILMIDKMWHHFILFTNDYEKFCNSFFWEDAPSHTILFSAPNPKDQDTIPERDHIERSQTRQT